MKKFVAADGLPYNEGDLGTIDFPDIPPAEEATPRLLWMISNGDLSVKITFCEVRRQEIPRKQVILFYREDVCFAMLKVLAVPTIGNSPRAEKTPLIAAMNLVHLLCE